MLLYTMSLDLNLKLHETNVCPISNINYDIVVQNNLYIETSKYNY